MQNFQNEHSYKRFILDFLSGGVAGAISKTVAAPIERVKLLMQTGTENLKLTRPYKSIAECFTRCIKEEGVLSLWRGNSVNVIRYFPTQALNFSFKEKFNSIFNPFDPKKQKSLFFWGSILSGGLAGCATICFVYPLDFTRTRLSVDLGRQKSDRQFTGIIDCMKKVYKTDGIRGTYQGFGMCLFGIFVYRGLYFGTYDSGKQMLLPLDKKDNLIWKFFFAQSVVIFSETVSYPTDTVKRKMMMQSARGGQVLYKNSIDCCIQMYQKFGVKSFYIGNMSNIIRSFGSSLCLVLYDEIREYSLKY
ncbi:mitochondrial carrier protein, putative [Ichthyophthirius multifiliis]|uniref:ADP/ATP translocase n=1 Tax=Ichthyophthirius multifiliis TaxID=5932 RepID=G0QUN5_ICHMU|nr:mitochondrial carrier protein, putative [Ichthyophthirius multifiliis]EGR31081.1 mitochondrial carrier protein, putative [Ichthyophthirius multifiliis]|eukprot:XP_004034567.1 mitochondrial carrier protein, putative [Ichthyophthirius multifiliis]